MRLVITAKNFKLTKSIKNFVEEKFKKLEGLVPTNEHVSINFEVDKMEHKAQGWMFINKSLVKVTVKEKDLYVAIDNLVDKLKFHISRAIEKSHETTHESIRLLENPKENFAEENEGRKIVKRKSFEMKPMMEEEAILQMELLGHSFFMFFNAETDSMCLLYKRKDGNYGLIEGIS